MAHSLTTSQIDQIVDSVNDCEDCADAFFDGIDRLSAILDRPSFEALLDAFDICKKHLCDIEICIDDQLDCIER